MIECAVVAGREYDELFERVIDSIVAVTEQKDDDFLLICVGETGTGKSRLMLHGYGRYDPREASVDYIGLNRKKHARALRLAKQKKRRRFTGDDEANVSKRDALTKYNKDRIDLYYAIRGLNIFHWWNNPSLDMIDKPFIEERVRGVIVVITKGKDVRFYYYFTKKGILKLLEKHGNLKLQTLKKHGPQYAHHLGWFRDYKGHLLKPYLAEKNQRMDDKVEDFFAKYGGEETLSLRAVINRLGIANATGVKYARLALREGVLPPESRTPTGQWVFTEETLEDFRSYVYSKASMLGEKQ